MVESNPVFCNSAWPGRDRQQAEFLLSLKYTDGRSPLFLPTRGIGPRTITSTTTNNLSEPIKGVMGTDPTAKDGLNLGP